MTKVKCDVKNCKYWEKGNLCVAEEIAVLAFPYHSAYSKMETFCDTFEMRNDDDHYNKD